MASVIVAKKAQKRLLAEVPAGEPIEKTTDEQYAGVFDQYHVEKLQNIRFAIGSILQSFQKTGLYDHKSALLYDPLVMVQGCMEDLFYDLDCARKRL
jgi:hypothetical protein